VSHPHVCFLIKLHPSARAEELSGHLYQSPGEDPAIHLKDARSHLPDCASIPEELLRAHAGQLVQNLFIICNRKVYSLNKDSNLPGVSCCRLILPEGGPFIAISNRMRIPTPSGLM